MRIGRAGKALLVIGTTTAAISLPEAAVASAKPGAVPTPAVTCSVSGTASFSNTGEPQQGINYVPRNVTVAGFATAQSCVDSRGDKTATDGHSVIGYTDRFSGSFPSSSCVSAGGTLSLAITWILDNGSTRTTRVLENFQRGNIFEDLPGAGIATKGLFAGALFESNAFLGNPVSHALECATDAGVTDTGFTSTITVLQ